LLELHKQDVVFGVDVVDQVVMQLGNAGIQGAPSIARALGRCGVDAEFGQAVANGGNSFKDSFKMNVLYWIKFIQNESFIEAASNPMRLTQWTDYTLRVLMYCATSQARAQPVTITEIADSHGVSRSHLTKIVHQLGSQGLLDTTRGRGGGMRLSRPAAEINVGAVVRQTETDFAMVECFEPGNNHCGLIANCHLQGLLHQATDSFLAVLDGVSLADLVAPANRAHVQMPASRRASPAPGVPQ
jgi:Rrf2 family nitric oxide-sensitive transcriptional repressor